MGHITYLMSMMEEAIPPKDLFYKKIRKEVFHKVAKLIKMILEPIVDRLWASIDDEKETGVKATVAQVKVVKDHYDKWMKMMDKQRKESIDFNYDLEWEESGKIRFIKI